MRDEDVLKIEDDSIEEEVLLNPDDLDESLDADLIDDTDLLEDDDLLGLDSDEDE